MFVVHDSHPNYNSEYLNCRFLPETLRAIIGDGSIPAVQIYTASNPVIGRHRRTKESNERPPRKRFTNLLLMFAYPDVFALLFLGTYYAVMYGVTASLSVIFSKIYPKWILAYVSSQLAEECSSAHWFQGSSWMPGTGGSETAKPKRKRTRMSISKPSKRIRRFPSKRRGYRSCRPSCSSISFVSLGTVGLSN